MLAKFAGVTALEPRTRFDSVDAPVAVNVTVTDPDAVPAAPALALMEAD